MEYTKTRNGMATLTYHLIIVTKYRKPVFDNQLIIYQLKQHILEISSNFDVEILNQECGIDNICIMFTCSIKTDLVKYINSLKGATSRKLRSTFSEHISKLIDGDSFWSPSYYIASAGNVSLQSLIEYINNQNIG